ncbi:MAG: heme-binding domain-containing protein [Roseiflexaceae bacterium]
MQSNKLVRLGFIGLIGVALVIQLIPVWLWQTNPPTVAEPAWSNPQAREIAQKACFDCHSNQTDWPLYGRIAPVSWLVTYDVVKGRSELNFSMWGTAAAGEAAMEPGEIAEVIQEGEMPPQNYFVTHPQAKLTPEEQQILIREFQRIAYSR